MKKKALLCKMLAFTAAASMLLASCGDKGNSSSTGGNSSTPTGGGTSGTTSGTASGSTGGDVVNLEWYMMLYGIGPDMDLMVEAANKYSSEKIGATITLHPYTMGDYANTVPTMVSSGIYMDMVQAPIDCGLPYVEYARKNAFVQIDEYLDTILAGSKALLPDAVWDAMTVDGHIYGIPPQKDFAYRLDFSYNKDVTDDINIQPPTSWVTFYDLVDWLYKVREAKDAKYPEDAQIPLLPNVVAADWYFTDISALTSANVPGLPGCAGYAEDGSEVFCSYMTDEYRTAGKKIRQMVKDYIFPSQSDFDPDGIYRQEGKVIGSVGAGLLSLDEDTNMPYYKTGLFVRDVATLNTAGILVGPQCISVQSKNVEKALEYLNLVNTDQYLATTLRYGPEGEGWTDNDNNNIFEDGPRNSDSAARGWYHWYGWQFGGLYVTKVPAGNDENFSKLMTDFNKNSNQEANIGFSFDNTAVATEVAACNNVVGEFNNTIRQGQTDDVDGVCDEFNEKLKANGIEKVIAECQKQLNEWRAAMGRSVKK